MIRPPRLLLVAAALAVVAVGLPWSGHPSGPDAIHTDAGRETVLLGGQHPVRVLAVVGALLIWAALRRGSRRGALTGLAVAAAALPIGGWGGGAPGRVCYLLALLIAAAAVVAERPAADPAPAPASTP